jgi:uncharacterized protein YmfQ (DUF2313 family)
VGLDVAAYARQLKQLLPLGVAWNLESGSVLSKLLLGLADELARVDARGETLINEWDPRTTLELLEDWERVLGLPDGCLLQLPDAIGERQVLATQKAIAVGGQSRQFYIDLAATLGYVVTITEFRPMRVGFHAGDRCLGTDWAHAWQVNLPVSDAGAIRIFRAGSRAGERLRGYGALDIECIIGRAAPAHSIVLFAYS